MTQSKAEIATRLIAAEVPTTELKASLLDAFPGITDEEIREIYKRAFVALDLAKTGFILGYRWPDIEPRLRKHVPNIGVDEIHLAREFGLGLAIFGAKRFALRGKYSASTTVH